MKGWSNKMNHKPESTRDFLRKLSQQELLDVGLNEIAYIKRREGSAAPYSVHAADGTQISVMDSLDTALVSVWHHNLHAVTLH